MKPRMNQEYRDKETKIKYTYVAFNSTTDEATLVNPAIKPDRPEQVYKTQIVKLDDFWNVFESA